ncbi:hypothetical protein QYM41_15695 [Kocuria sp. CPCC 205268]|uniref:hypothetical protein n=1 Tax=Kocuria oxytropis TaxID=3058913 RepID=UPI0034D57D0D
MTLQSDLRADHPGTSGHEAAGPRTAHQDGFGRNATGPLAGIVVADFSRVLAGPSCTMLLAERLGLEPVVGVGEGGMADAGHRRPIGFSATPAGDDLVPPGLDADRDAVLAWLDARPQHA